MNSNPDNIKIEAFKSFEDRTLAYLFKSKLESHGIAAFISNEHTSDLIHIFQAGYILNIEQKHFEQANALYEEFMIDMATKPEEDFRDATHADIEYEKQLNEFETGKLAPPNRMITIITWVIILVIAVLLGMRYYG